MFERKTEPAKRSACVHTPRRNGRHPLAAFVQTAEGFRTDVPSTLDGRFRFVRDARCGVQQCRRDVRNEEAAKTPPSEKTSGQKINPRLRDNDPSTAGDRHAFTVASGLRNESISYRSAADTRRRKCVTRKRYRTVIVVRFSLYGRPRACVVCSVSENEISSTDSRATRVRAGDNTRARGPDSNAVTFGNANLFTAVEHFQPRHNNAARSTRVSTYHFD